MCVALFCSFLYRYASFFYSYTCSRPTLIRPYPRDQQYLEFFSFLLAPLPFFYSHFLPTLLLFFSFLFFFLSFSSPQNGLRFISNKGEILDIMYGNIKHAIYQPCDKTTMVLVHFHLKVLTLHCSFTADGGAAEVAIFLDTLKSINFIFAFTCSFSFFFFSILFPLLLPQRRRNL